MPYIKQEERKDFDTLISELEMRIMTPGQLNYVITSLAKNYHPRKWSPDPEDCGYMGYQSNPGRGSYAWYNEIIGVLECAKLEFYRRAISIYENDAIKRNGDIY
jgi:hypothetical protein